MIHFSHVYKTYLGHIHALKNIDLKVDKGEFVFVTGPSGAGKTTLFKVLSAFDPPSSGLVNVVGFDLNRLSREEVSKFRQKIGVVFQDFKLLKNRTVFENVALPLLVKGEPNHQIHRRVLDVLKKVGLSQKMDKYPEFISGGEQQRTAIARAIVHRPGILIADEPTGNLDPMLREEIMDLLERVCAQGTTVLVATHDLDMVTRRAKRNIKIQNGLISEDHCSAIAF